MVRTTVDSRTRNTWRGVRSLELVLVFNPTSSSPSFPPTATAPAIPLLLLSRSTKGDLELVFQKVPTQGRSNILSRSVSASSCLVSAFGFGSFWPFRKSNPFRVRFVSRFFIWWFVSCVVGFRIQDPSCQVPR